MKRKTQKIRRPISFRTEGVAQVPPMVKTSLALGMSTFMLMPMTAIAAEQAEQAETKEVTLGTVKVEDTAIDPNPNAEPGVPYKAKYSGDERHTRPLAETPQNISVLTKAQIDDSGYTDLRAILDAQPGITLGTGENGNAFGDRYIIRGQEARSDVFVDGLRDPGMTIRESFATEQVEISKGPNSSFAGRGTSGGAVNSVTKQATMDYDFAKLSAGVGTDEHARPTLDTNQVISDKMALRANALYGYEKVPDRGPADRARKGLALSGLFLPNDKLDIVLDYYGMRAEDNPDLGSYLVGTVPNRVPAKNVPVYAQKQDFMTSDVDTVTGRIKFKITPDMRITNNTRFGTSDNAYVATGARAATTGINNPTGVYSTATLSTHQGWQEVEYFANQTNLFLDKTIAGKKHEFIVGLEYTDHAVLNGVYSVTNSGQNCITGTGVVLNAWCITDASGNVVNGLNTLMNRQIVKGAWDQDWAIKTTSLSLLDTVDITEKFTAFAGIRRDHFDYNLKAYWNHDGDSGAGATPTVLGNFKDADAILNGHVGVTYKFRPEANIYATYSTASDINGGESDVGASSGYGGLAVNYVCTDRTNPNPALRGCDPNGSIEAKPETTQNLELGTKWNVMGGKLLATASVFQITKSNVMEGSGYEAGASFNTGKNRVRGIEFGLTGMLTDKLTAQAGVTFMKAEVLESATAANVGKTLSNFADNTASAQLRYQATPQLAIGGAVKYEGKKYAGQPDTAAAYDTGTGLYSQPVPAYTVVDLFANYRLKKNLDMRLNIGNVADKDYYLAAYRSGSFLYKGDARNVRLTLNYDF
ncbi:MAG: TonB-dependent receptor [Hydrogenophilaceae bacterium]|nr:TonB-dependent receptor [Hydrogenophilaceae bacterium]